MGGISANATETELMPLVDYSDSVKAAKIVTGRVSLYLKVKVMQRDPSEKRKINTTLTRGKNQHDFLLKMFTRIKI